MKTAKDFLEEDKSGVYSEQDIQKAMIGFADEFAIGFVEWKDKISDSDLMYSEKYAKSNVELLVMYKKTL